MDSDQQELFDLRLMVGSVKDYAILMLDPDGLVVSWNEGARRIEGYEAKEIIGRPFSCFYPLEDIADGKPENALRAAVNEGRYEDEGWRVRKDGSRFWADVVITPLRGEGGALRGFCKVTRDISEKREQYRRIQEANRDLRSSVASDVSERRQLEDQLRLLQKMEAVGLLAGGIAHDFNNLLTVILGYGSILSSRFAPGVENREELDEMLRASERAAALTRQLLAFSRRQVLEPVVLSVNDLIADLEKMLGRLIGEHMNMVTRLDPSLGNVRADPGQLEQVIMNLAVNARDAMPQGGKLTIETANAELDEPYAQHHATVQQGRYVMMAVSDTGTGMNAETQAHIFEPFFTTKEKGKGTGLGLSTVYGIVKQSGGNIWVYSEEGVGTTFKVYLPRVDAAVRGDRTPTHDPVPTDGTETILLVEDDASIRGLAKRVLEGKGYRVLEASGGSEAFERNRDENGPIDLLLTDLVMADIGGVELATRLQELHPDLHVLFMSGYTDDAVLRNGLLVPGRAFLQKPFTPKILLRKVRDVLG